VKRCPARKMVPGRLATLANELGTPVDASVGAVRPPVFPVIIEEVYARIHKRTCFLVKRHK
jgi:hypothetical protein